MRTAFLLGLLALGAQWAGNSALAEDAPAASNDRSVTATDYQRQTIYHSPQSPGYTCWAFIWTMPDESLMISFLQATGPLEGRRRAPDAILRQMPNAQQKDPNYDFTGLKLENIFLHSSDGGKTWRQTASEPFESCLNGSIGGGILAGSDGTLFCNVWGQDLVYSDVLPTGFLRRSVDGGKMWSAPEYLSQDPKLQTWPKRIRRLRDGRFAVTGAACPFDKNTWVWEELSPQFRACLWVSKDVDGKSWTEPLYVASPGESTEEWDVAELENGDLLGVFRTFDKKRCQCLLTKQNATWQPGPLQPLPIPHSGQPELLVAREGVVLHIASNGIWWTADRGATWTKLNIPGSAYYPSAVQRKDGSILVVSHIGNDDPYGKVDQSIVLDRFRLETQ